MLTEKDYCDYDTCVALRELGCRIESEWYIHQPSYERGSCYLCFGIPRETSVLDECDYIPRLSLYEAQKWLREEKKLIVLVSFDFCPITSEIVYNWVMVVTGNTAKKSSYTYDYFEEALSEAVRASIKILKENETIHK